MTKAGLVADDARLEAQVPVKALSEVLFRLMAEATGLMTEAGRETKTQLMAEVLKVNEPEPLAGSWLMAEAGLDAEVMGLVAEVMVMVKTRPWGQTRLEDKAAEVSDIHGWLYYHSLGDHSSLTVEARRRVGEKAGLLAIAKLMATSGLVATAGLKAITGKLEGWVHNHRGTHRGFFLLLGT